MTIGTETRNKLLQEEISNYGFLSICVRNLKCLQVWLKHSEEQIGIDNLKCYLISLLKKECIPVGCVPPALYRGGCLTDKDPNLDRDLPRQRPPGQRTPPHRDPPAGQRPSWTGTALDRGP